jgi:hypothetical protein
MSDDVGNFINHLVLVSRSLTLHLFSSLLYYPCVNIFHLYPLMVDSGSLPAYSSEEKDFSFDSLLHGSGWRCL